MSLRDSRAPRKSRFLTGSYFLSGLVAATGSRSREQQQGLNIVVISRPKSPNILPAQFAHIMKRTSTPGKRLAAEPF